MFVKLAEILRFNNVSDKHLSDQIDTSMQKQKNHEKRESGFCLTQVLDGVVALLVVHFDGLSVGTADAVPDGITTHHDVLVLWWRPAHHDAVDQGADMERAGLVWDTGLWGANK